MAGPILTDDVPLLPARPRQPGAPRPLPAWARLRAAARATGLSLAALAFTVGTAAAATQVPGGTGPVVQAVGSKIATVTTVVHDGYHVATSSVAVGKRVHPAFVVMGNDGTPTGQATVSFYSSSDCSTGLQSSWAAPLPANATFDSTSINTTSKVATTSSMRVKYLGDATYAAAFGPCRSITFTKIDPTIALHVHDWNDKVVTQVPFTMEVHAAVSVDGSLGTPTGFVLVRGWANGTCSGSVYDYTSQTLDANGDADWVLPLTFASPSMRSYQTRYSGNGSYNAIWSPCVSIEGTKADTALTFVLHDASHAVPPLTVAVGTAIHVASGVSGQAGQPTGTITAHVYTGKDCQTLAYDSTVPASASIDNGTFGKAFPGAPGFISWKLAYSGDASYKPQSSACVNRQFLAEATVTISVHDASHDPVTSIFLGDKVHLSVSISGAFGPVTGKLALQADETGACSNGAAFSVVTLGGGTFDDASLTFKPHAVETAWFMATVIGDGTVYGRSSSACVPVQIKAAPATPTPKPTVMPTPKPTAVPAGPAATAAPGASATPASGADPLPTASAEPSAVPVPVTAAPAVTEPAEATSAPGATDPAVAGGPIAPSDGTSSGSVDLLPFGLLVLALLAGLGAWFATASRRRAGRGTTALGRARTS